MDKRARFRCATLNHRPIPKAVYKETIEIATLSFQRTDESKDIGDEVYIQCMTSRFNNPCGFLANICQSRIGQINRISKKHTLMPTEIRIPNATGTKIIMFAIYANSGQTPVFVREKFVIHLHHQATE